MKVMRITQPFLIRPRKYAADDDGYDDDGYADADDDDGYDDDDFDDDDTDMVGHT